jgi:hypothetical protein
MDTIKSFYYQFVNFIQTMPALWFVTIWLLVFAGTLVLIMKFFKAYNGTQKNFEKLSLIVCALLLFGLLVYLTSIR